MSAPRVLDLLRSPLRHLGYQPSFAGLLRIAGFALLFLVLLGFALPQLPPSLPRARQLERVGIVPMLTRETDPRFVRDDFRAFPDDGRPRLAWIGGSSLILEPEHAEAPRAASRSYVPERVAAALRDRHATEAHTFLYLRQAARIVDTYAMVQDALGREPDLLVVTLNPFWVLNEKALFRWRNVFNRGAALWWNPRDWPWLLRWTPPRAHLWAFLGRHVPAVDALYDYRELMPRAIRGTSNGHRPPARARERSEPAFRYKQPLQFWIAHRRHGGDLSVLAPPGERPDARAWQAEAMAMAEPDPTSSAHRILERMLDRIAESGVPALVYTAPVSPGLAEHPDARRVHAQVRTRLDGLAERYRGPSLRFQSRIPEPVQRGLVFRDHLHLSDEGGLAGFLAAELEALGAAG